MKLIAVLLIFFSILNPLSGFSKEKLTLENGKIDFANWDFETQGSVYLGGNWGIYPNKILKPEDFLNNYVSYPPQNFMSRSIMFFPMDLVEEITVTPFVGDFLSVSTQKNINNLIKDKKIVTSDKSSLPERIETISAVAHIKNLDAANKDLAFFMKDISYSYEVFLVQLDEYDQIIPNQKIDYFIKVGTIGEDRESTIPHRKRIVKQIPEKYKNFLVVFNIASRHHSNHGMARDAVIGLYDTLVKEEGYQNLINMVSIGIMVIMAIYHFGLFSQRREDVGSLIFGLFNVLFALRFFSMETYLDYVIPAPSLAWFELAYKMEYLLLACGLQLFYTFLKVLFPTRASRRITMVAWALGGFGSLNVLFGSAHWYTGFLGSYQLSLLFLAIPMLSSMAYAAFKKDEGAWVCFGGAIVMFGCAVNDILHANNAPIPHISLHIVPFGLLFFIFCQSYLISGRFSNTYKKVEELNANLEQKVEERTAQLAAKNRDVNSMLQNLTQGILTVTPENNIHQEYSAFLEQIYETKEIAGQNAISFIFNGADLGIDAIDQTRTCIENSIGEDVMSYDINCGLLASEFKKQMPNGDDKYLELSWSPICDEDEIVEKVMVSIKDVTEVKALSAESEQQRKRLDQIGKIVNIPSKDFDSFLSSAIGYIEDNKKIISDYKSTEIDKDVIQVLFRNMHTIKGNARTYDFEAVSNTAHVAEHEYDMMRKDELTEWNSESLLENLEQVNATLMELQDINDNVLGRKEGQGHQAVMENAINDIRGSLEMINLDDKETSKTVINDIVTKIRHLSLSRFEDIITPIFVAVKDIAQELGRDEPKIKFKGVDTYHDKEVTMILKDTFTHLLRNSIDHGIELPDVRKEKGKQEIGTIFLDQKVVGDEIQFVLADDGAGINLKKIYDKALSTKVIDEGKEYSDQEIVNLIFKSGFSTAAKVSDISGRGVGMDAVNNFLNKIGGTIEVKFTEKVEDRSKNYPVQWIIHIPNVQK